MTNDAGRRRAACVCSQRFTSLSVERHRTLYAYVDRVSNPRPIARIKTGRVYQPISQTQLTQPVATGLRMQRAPGNF